MRLRRLLTGLTAAIAATLALDRLLRRMASPLPPAVAGRPSTVRDAGIETAVVEAGAPTGPEVIFVHGTYVGASSREFADLVEHLPADLRLVLVDLPGFGRSGRPSVDYDIERLAGGLASVIDECGEPPTVVASGQALPVAVAAAEQADIDRLIAIGPRTENDRRRPILATLLETPVIGTMAYLGLSSRPALAAHLVDTLELHQTGLTDDHLSYAWRSAHQPGSVGAATAWIGGDLDVLDDLETLLDSVDVDTALVIGEEATTPSLEAVRSAAERIDATLSTVSASGAFPHITAPDAVAAHLVDEALLA